MALPAQRGDHRFPKAGLVPIRLAAEGQLFEVVQARHDCLHAWFERLDGRADPAAASYLREAHWERIPPERLRRRGLTAEQREAFTLVYCHRQEAERNRTEDRLRLALGHAGADLYDYRDQGDGYRVEYAVKGVRHVSLVNKRDLSAQSAGICLSGEDHRFDLQSLIGVLQEAQGEQEA
jgi:hypothetical protein